MQDTKIPLRTRKQFWYSGKGLKCLLKLYHVHLEYTRQNSNFVCTVRICDTYGKVHDIYGIVRDTYGTVLVLVNSGYIVGRFYIQK